jgi:hypothetical protein
MATPAGAALFHAFQHRAGAPDARKEREILAICGVARGGWWIGFV